MLDAHQLHVFLIAAETLNFTQAAGRLNMSQPSVSQHILALEQQFEQPLFLRSGRNIQLTDSGVTLLPLARELVTRTMQIEEVMKSLEGEVHGHLKIGCSTTPAKYLLPNLLSQFHCLHPRVTISCQAVNQKQALEYVHDGTLHFALVSQSDVLCKSAELHELVDEAIRLIVPKNHPWARRTEIEPEELYLENFIFQENNSDNFLTVQNGLESLGVDYDRFKKLLILDNLEMVIMAVREGLGLGFASEIIVEKLAKDDVVFVSVRGLDLKRKISICRNVRRPTTTAQMVFWDFIVNAIKDFHN